MGPVFMAQRVHIAAGELQKERQLIFTGTHIGIQAISERYSVGHFPPRDIPGMLLIISSDRLRSSPLTRTKFVPFREPSF